VPARGWHVGAHAGGDRLRGSRRHSRRVDDGAAVLFVRDLVAAGRLRTVIDRTYPLERIVEAHRYVDTGHKKGNVVITVGHANRSGTDR
jgi:NADPH2:quinone reductase